jgi:hypothetical protein
VAEIDKKYICLGKESVSMSEGRRKKEEGRRKKEEERRKKKEGTSKISRVHRCDNSGYLRRSNSDAPYRDTLP